LSDGDASFLCFSTQHHCHHNHYLQQITSTQAAIIFQLKINAAWCGDNRQKVRDEQMLTQIICLNYFVEHIATYV